MTGAVGGAGRVLGGTQGVREFGELKVCHVPLYGAVRSGLRVAGICMLGDPGGVLVKKLRICWAHANA